MIDVQATLRSVGRCIVPPEAQILGITANNKADCGRHPWGYANRTLVDPKSLKLRPIYPGIDESPQSFFVSTDGLTLFLWNSVSEYRDNGREKRDHLLGRTLGEPGLDNLGGRDNMWFRMECVAWLLDLEYIRRGG